MSSDVNNLPDRRKSTQLPHSWTSALPASLRATWPGVANRTPRRNNAQGHQRDKRTLLRLRDGLPLVADMIPNCAHRRRCLRNQSRVIPRNKLIADNESLREPVRARLHGIFEVQSPATAVAEKVLEARCVFGSRNNKNLTYAREHKRRQRVIDTSACRTRGAIVSKLPA